MRLIDADALIDTLKKHFGDDDDNRVESMFTSDVYWHDNTVLDVIRSVPSAQQWVPVWEDMPPKLRAVLGYVPEYNNIFALTLHADGWHIWHPWRSEIFPEDAYGKVVAWMLMPEVYKGEVRI